MAKGDDPEVDLDEPLEEGDDVEKPDLDIDEQEDESPEEGEEVEAQGEQAGDRQQSSEERQPSRGEQRQQRLANELKEARQRESELNRRLDMALATRPQQPQPQGETPEARAQRLALLTPEERITAELQETKQTFAREMQVMRFTAVDGNDRAAFQAKATVDPLYKRWEPEVEAELAKLRTQGQTVEREKLMYFLIGKAAVEKRDGSKGTQRAEGQRRVASQRVRPSNSGSDIAANRRGDRGNSLERRLENQSL